MKLGRLITEDGLELSVETAQVIELADYLRHKQRNEIIADEVAASNATLHLIDPEDYERAAQAAYFAQANRARPAAA